MSTSWSSSTPTAATYYGLRGFRKSLSPSLQVFQRRWRKLVLHGVAVGNGVDRQLCERGKAGPQGMILREEGGQGFDIVRIGKLDPLGGEHRLDQLFRGLLAW